MNTLNGTKLIGAMDVRIRDAKRNILEEVTSFDLHFGINSALGKITLINDTHYIDAILVDIKKDEERIEFIIAIQE
jgi:hypothetical protein